MLLATAAGLSLLLPPVAPAAAPRGAGTSTRAQGRGAQRARQRDAPPPAFADYPAAEVYRGRPAPVVLRTRRDRAYRTRLREDSRAGPNFAGRYTVVFWGCGTGCAQLAVVDARTGRVYWPPFDYVDIPSPEREGGIGLGYRPDSRLLVVTRSAYDAEGTYAAFYYLFERNRFRLLRRAERKTSPRTEADSSNDNQD